MNKPRPEPKVEPTVSGKPTWKVIVATVAFTGLGIGGVYYLHGVLKLDPMARYRANLGAKKPGDIAIKMEDVSIRTFEGKRLVGKAHVGSLGITQDRRSIETFAITDGVYYADNGDPFNFVADEGVWSQDTKIFEARKGAKMTGKDLELSVDAFKYDQVLRKIEVPGDIQGKLSGGTVQAKTFAYMLRDNSYELGPVTWVGQVDTTGDAKKRSKWTIKAKSVNRPSGSEVEISLNAEATDGDVILKADKVERNVKTDVVTATGKVQYFSKEANLLCDKVTVFRKEKRAVLEGNVSMLIKPEDQERLEVTELQPLRPVVPDDIAATRPDAPTTRSEEEKRLDDEVRSTENRRKYPATLLAAKIEYWYADGQRKAIITGTPQARQELPGGRWRQIWANKAIYDGEKETLRLESSPEGRETRIMTSLGDDMRAKWFEVSTKENDDAWSAEDLDGVFMPDEDEIPKKPGDKSNSGGGVQAPPPGMQGEIRRRPN